MGVAVAVDPASLDAVPLHSRLSRNSPAEHQPCTASNRHSIICFIQCTAGSTCRPVHPLKRVFQNIHLGHGQAWSRRSLPQPTVVALYVSCSAAASRPGHGGRLASLPDT